MKQAQVETIQTRTSSLSLFFCWCVFRNGVGRSGVFCAVSTVAEKITSDDAVDIFQAVKRLRMNRPLMVETLVSTEHKHISYLNPFLFLFFFFFF